MYVCVCIYIYIYITNQQHTTNNAKTVKQTEHRQQIPTKPTRHTK